VRRNTIPTILQMPPALCNICALKCQVGIPEYGSVSRLLSLTDDAYAIGVSLVFVVIGVDAVSVCYAGAAYSVALAGAVSRAAMVTRQGVVCQSR
jgi:hypothetical protein